MPTYLRMALAALTIGLGLVGCQPTTTPDKNAARAPEAVTDSAGIRLVGIPAGEFQMGGERPAEDLINIFPPALYNAGPEDFSDEYPRHRARITRPFYIGQHEVTVGQFLAFVKETDYQSDAEKDGQGGWGYNEQKRKIEGRQPRYTWKSPGFTQSDDHPVVNVSANDALAFCAWLSKKEGKTYRLPTEAEWEYACRAGSTTLYHNGDDPEKLGKAARALNFKLAPKFGHVHTIEMPPEGPFTTKVGSYEPNAWGLYDMHGNAWEWCSDWYDEEYYAKSPVDDPTGPASGTVRVRRGGGWNSFPLYARSSYRNYLASGSRCVNLGFRVVREAPR